MVNQANKHFPFKIEGNLNNSNTTLGAVSVTLKEEHVLLRLQAKDGWLRDTVRLETVLAGHNRLSLMIRLLLKNLLLLHKLQTLEQVVLEQLSP